MPDSLGKLAVDGNLWTYLSDDFQVACNRNNQNAKLDVYSHEILKRPVKWTIWKNSN